MNFNESKVFTLATDLTAQWVGGWFWQEKIRDCRVMWTGREFITRHGNVVAAPKWFTKGLPRIRIDGGIWAGRHGFQIASNAVRFGGHHFDDPDLRFTPFDLPDCTGTWDQRIHEAQKAVAGVGTATVLPWGVVRDDNRHYGELLLHHARLGCEGVMFRQPELQTYEQGRTKNLLREKFTAN